MQRNFGKIIAARSISAAAGQQASRLACITPMRDIRVTGKEETDGDTGAQRFDSPIRRSVVRTDR